jgi:hypothetical protein
MRFRVVADHSRRSTKIRALDRGQLQWFKQRRCMCQPSFCLQAVSHSPPRTASACLWLGENLRSPCGRHPLEWRSPGIGPICSKNCTSLSSLLPNCLLELLTMRTFEQLCGKLFARAARPRIPTTPLAGSLIFRCIRESSTPLAV